MVFLPWTISDKALWVHQVWKPTQNIHTFYLLSWIREKKNDYEDFIFRSRNIELRFDLILFQVILWVLITIFKSSWYYKIFFHLMNDIVWFYNAVKLYVFQRMCFKLNSIFGWTNCPKIDHLINDPI